MTLVKINEYGECESRTCPFARECAQHRTAGDFRSEDGFSPDITLSGEKHAICGTFSQPILPDDLQCLPANYHELDRGFVPLFG